MRTTARAITMSVGNTARQKQMEVTKSISESHAISICRVFDFAWGA